MGVISNSMIEEDHVLNNWSVYASRNMEDGEVSYLFLCNGNAVGENNLYRFVKGFNKEDLVLFVENFFSFLRGFSKKNRAVYEIVTDDNETFMEYMRVFAKALDIDCEIQLKAEPEFVKYQSLEGDFSVYENKNATKAGSRFVLYYKDEKLDNERFFKLVGDSNGKEALAFVRDLSESSKYSDRLGSEKYFSEIFSPVKHIVRVCSRVNSLCEYAGKSVKEDMAMLVLDSFGICVDEDKFKGGK